MQFLGYIPCFEVSGGCNSLGFFYTEERRVSAAGTHRHGIWVVRLPSLLGSEVTLQKPQLNALEARLIPSVWRSPKSLFHRFSF